jgi:hypothetical protein
MESGEKSLETNEPWDCDEAYLISGAFGRGAFQMPFCASIGFTDDVCTFAAPILVKTMLGRDRNVCLDIIQRRGWKVLG